MSDYLTSHEYQCLNDDAQAAYDDWYDSYGCCHCATSPAPCGSCTHIGNPENLRNFPGAWRPGCGPNFSNHGIVFTKPERGTVRRDDAADVNRHFIDQYMQEPAPPLPEPEEPVPPGPESTNELRKYRYRSIYD